MPRSLNASVPSTLAGRHRRAGPRRRASPPPAAIVAAVTECIRNTIAGRGAGRADGLARLGERAQAAAGAARFARDDEPERAGARERVEPGAREHPLAVRTRRVRRDVRARDVADRSHHGCSVENHSICPFGGRER